MGPALVSPESQNPKPQAVPRVKPLYCPFLRAATHPDSGRHSTRSLDGGHDVAVSATGVPLSGSDWQNSMLLLHRCLNPFSHVRLSKPAGAVSLQVCISRPVSSQSHWFEQRSSWYLGTQVPHISLCIATSAIEPVNAQYRVRV